MKNLVLISVDTLRHDAANTPAMRSWASSGVSFAQCVSSAPYTTNAHASMLTGLWPWNHGVRTLFKSRLKEGIRLLPDVLATKGFVSLCATGMPVLFHADQFQIGLAMTRCDHVDVSFSKTRQEASEVLDWLAKHRRDRFCIFYHLAGVHDYVTHTTRPVFESYQDGRLKKGNLMAALTVLHGGAVPLKAQRGDYYDSVRYLDEIMLAPLQKALKDLNLDRDTLVVLTADHGEGLIEKDRYHCRSVRDCVIRVPLIFSHPDLPGGRKIPRQVQLIDVVPTVLDLLGLKALRRELGRLDGRSLCPFFAGEPVEPRPAYAEFWNPQEPYPADRRFNGLIRDRAWPDLLFQWCVRTEGHKWLHDCLEGSVYWLDLERDPEEEHPVCISRVAEGKRDAERRQQIMELGYMG